MTESCSGRTGLLERIEWYVVPGVGLFSSHGEDVAGRYDLSRHRIVLAGAGQMDGGLVRHEMLHALVGVPGHPRSQFLERCGGVVVCLDTCIRDAEPPPTPGPLVHRVEPESLQVSVRVDPSEPIGSVDQGYFETIVSARNTSRDSVVIVLPKASDAGPPVAFRFDWSNERGGVSYDDRAWDPEVTIFAPGEIKQRVFDLHIDDKNEVVAGTDSVRGGYASHWSVPVEVTVIK